VSEERLDYAETMRYLLILILLLVCTASDAAEIYRTVDKDGNVIFTDTPTNDSEKIQLKETTTIKSLNAEPSSQGTTPPTKEEAFQYKSVFITAPAENETIQGNAGDVSVKVKVDPLLQPGDEVVVYLDGVEKMKGVGSTFNLEDIDRGTHQLRASVKDPDGHIVMSSKSTTFYLHRQSVIKRKKTTPSN